MGWFLALVASYAATVWCWWRIWHSTDLMFFKIALTIIAAIPLVGPFLYFFVDMPSRRPREPGQARKKPTPLLDRWNQREHVYLAWASVVFWSLAVLAWWMNDWHPGNIHFNPILWGAYTDVDVIFFALLIGAVLTMGAAIRIKIWLIRQMRELGVESQTV